ncbi:BlaI/MecI/CopY family transcriptional regulator, partial [Vibrio parahaemolyticus]
MQNLRRPTDAEYAILQVLWRHGPRSVREVYDELSRARDIGYTTVLKLLQIMLEKG